MRHSNKSLEGYLLIDHRASPGVQGHADPATSDLQFVPGGGLFESATITCSHCQRVVVLNPQRTRERGYCAKCDHYICDAPACHVDCRPFNAFLDTLQRDAFREEQSQKSTIYIPPSTEIT